MRKIRIIYMIYMIFILLPILTIADQTVNLNYSENVTILAFNSTDNSTFNVTVHAPVFNVPPAMNRTLNWNETNTTNNFTATCRAWDNSSCTIEKYNVNKTLNYSECYMNYRANVFICAPAYPMLNQAIQFTFMDMGVPELLNYTNPLLNLTVLNTPKPAASSSISLVPGQSQTFTFTQLKNLSSMTVSCSQNQSNCTLQDDCSQNLQWNLIAGQTASNSVCNIFASCALSGLENEYIQGTFGYHFFNARSNTTFDCPAYPSACGCVAKSEQTLNVDCSKDDQLRYSSINFTVNIKKCAACNLPAACNTSNESLANSSMQIVLSASDLASSDCTFSDLANGKVGNCLNKSFTLRDAHYATCQNDLASSRNDTETTKDKVTTCQSGQNLMMILIIVMGFVALVTVILVTALRWSSRSKTPR